MISLEPQHYCIRLEELGVLFGLASLAPSDVDTASRFVLGAGMGAAYRCLAQDSTRAMLPCSADYATCPVALSRIEQRRRIDAHRELNR